MDIRLTISLLASDRRESLERCLDSLKPLLARIPAELIVVFTGRDEKVREIAEKYTPQVITSEWCGDFSAARNAGLRQAQGEWFLYIDDDEWFDSVDEICEFFISGEYRQYRSAHYIQRNYQNWNGTKFSDFSVFRMVQRSPETRFQGAIHEELTPHMKPCKFFQTCVHHYGYVKDEENVQKTFRNIHLLLQAIQEHPDQIKNYIQLAKEYDLAGNLKLAEEYCRKGAAISRKADDPYSAGWLQAYFSRLASEKSSQESSVLEIKAILEQEQPMELTRLILFQQLVCLYAKSGEPEKAVESGQEFETLLMEMDEKEVLWEQQSYGEFCEDYVKSPERLYGTRASCSVCALKTGDKAAAAYFLKRLPWEEEDILCRYYSELEKWKEEYPSVCTDIFLEILSDMIKDFDLSDVSGIPEYSGVPAPVYLLFQKALDDFRNGKTEEGLNLFIYCIFHTDDSNMQQMLLKEAIRHQISVIPFVKQMDLNTWNCLVRNVVKELPFVFNERIRVCEEETENRFPLHGLCLKRERLGQKLLKGFPLWEEFLGNLTEYCLCIGEFYKGLYRDEWMGEEMNVFLPADYRFACRMLKALEELKRARLPEAVRLAGEAFHIYPDMTGIITELFRQAARRSDATVQRAGEEFLQLAGQMKGTLRTLTDTGQTAQAMEILDQLLPLMPEDQELIWIRQDLIRRMKS